MPSRRWPIGLITSLLGVPLLALGLVPLWVGGRVLGLRHPGWEWVYAITGFVLLVAAIFAMVAIQTSLVRWADARQTTRNVARLEHALAALRADPRLGRWAPLAERYRRVDRVEVAGWEARYQALLADPRRRPFAAHALSGDFPTDDEIDYLLDSSARRTCMHLRPVEEALRDAGVACALMRPAGGTTAHVATAATLDEPALRARYALPPFLEWQVTPPEPHEAGSERLACTRCGATIENGRGARFPGPA